MQIAVKIIDNKDLVSNLLHATTLITVSLHSQLPKLFPHLQTPVKLIFSDLSLKKSTHFGSEWINTHSDHIVSLVIAQKIPLILKVS